MVDAIIEGRELDPMTVEPLKRSVNYKAPSAADLKRYREDRVEGKGLDGDACVVPLADTARKTAIEGARVQLGRTYRGKTMKEERLDPSIEADLRRVGLEVGGTD